MKKNRIKRECKGRALAISRRVLSNPDSNGFYVESELILGRFYYVKIVFESSEIGSFWCSCHDFASNRSDKCKHVFAVEYASRLGQVQSIDKKLPISQFKKVVSPITKMSSVTKPKSWTDNTKKVEIQYKNESIRTLNEIEKAEIEAEAYSTHRQ